MDTYLWPRLCSNINNAGINSVQIFFFANKDGKNNNRTKARADMNQKCYSIYAVKKSWFTRADHQKADFQSMFSSAWE